MRDSSPTISLAEDIAVTREACAAALDRDAARRSRLARQGPADPYGWSELLRRGPAAGLAALAVRSGGGATPGELERHACLQAFAASLAAIADLPVVEAVKRLLCAVCRQAIAASPAAFNPAAFDQMAKVASLTWLPAGQLCFEFTGFPRSWLLKVHPLALPGLLHELAAGFGGRAPLVTTHLWTWRPNPFLVLPGENEKSLWRIAKTLELYPEVRGLMADPWYQSLEAIRAFPHLSWVRRFFEEQGAFFVELGPAPADAGFLQGSEKRRRLFDEGSFRPQRTLVLWRRAAMLAWAAAHPELDAGIPGPAPVAGRPPRPSRPAAPVPAAATGGRRPKLRPWELLDRRPKAYITATLVVPSSVVSLGIGLAQSWWQALPAFFAALPVSWLAQYFLLQRPRPFPNRPQVKHEHSRL